MEQNKHFLTTHNTQLRNEITSPQISHQQRISNNTTLHAQSPNKPTNSCVITNNATNQTNEEGNKDKENDEYERRKREEEKVNEVITKQLRETLHSILPLYLQSLKEEIKSLRETVESLRDELTSVPTFPSSVSLNSADHPSISPNYNPQNNDAYSISLIDSNNNSQPSLMSETADQQTPNFTHRIQRTIEDEKKFKDYCREAARMCLDLSKPWTSQKPSSKKEATKLVVEHTGASEEEVQNRFKKYLTHIKSYQKKTKAAAERGIGFDFMLTGKRSPPSTFDDDQSLLSSPLSNSNHQNNDNGGDHHHHDNGNNPTKRICVDKSHHDDLYASSPLDDELTNLGSS